MQLDTFSVDTTARRRENQLYTELFPKFVDYYSSHVRRYALAKELATVAIGKVMTRLGTYDHSKPLENWAMRIASNYLIDYYRQRASQKHQLVQVLSGSEVGNVDDYDNFFSRGLVEGAAPAEQDYALLESQVMDQLRTWPGVDGDIIRASLFQGHSTPAIAVLLGVSEKRVKRVLSESKALLEGQLLEAEA